MTESPTIHRVEVTFTGTPPGRPIEIASGVSDVEVDGHTLRCLVHGSVQPFLEAIRGYEVTNLTAVEITDRPEHDGKGVNVRPPTLPTSTRSS